MSSARELSPKAAKRLSRAIDTLDRAVDQFAHPEISELFRNWNGDRNIRANIIEFIEWHRKVLP